MDASSAFLHGGLAEYEKDRYIDIRYIHALVYYKFKNEVGIDKKY